MNPSDMKRSIIEDAGENSLEVDETGHLYSPEMRRVMSGTLPPECLPAVEAFTALGLAARLMHLRMERWAERHGLSEQRIGLLFMLHHAQEGMPLGALAARMHVSPRNVTGLVDNLERDGLVVRVHDPSDRRSVLATLTPRGSQIIESIWQLSIDYRRELLEGFTPEELTELRHLALRLVQKMTPSTTKETPHE